MARALTLAYLCFTLLGTVGCAVGYNSMLFVTKTNYGVDFDTQPPAAQISVSRVEGVIQPTFEGGQTLPVMASFRATNNSLFNSSVSQTFATGNAAVAMATLYGSPDYTPEGSEDSEKMFSSQISVTQQPCTGSSTDFVQPGEVMPVFFGTNTSLGLSITWSAVASPIPDSMQLGYRRRELAIAPIGFTQTVDANDGTAGTLNVPSLLATIDVGTQVGAPNNTNAQWLQYFATGQSATALALRQDVRQAMLRRLNPAFGLNGQSAGLVRAVILAFQRPNDLPNPAQVQQVMQRLNAAAAALSPQGFIIYGPNDDGVTAESVSDPIDSARGMLAFLENAEFGHKLINDALSANATFEYINLNDATVSVAAGNNPARAALLNAIADQERRYAEISQAFYSHPAASEVVELFLAYSNAR